MQFPKRVQITCFALSLICALFLAGCSKTVTPTPIANSSVNTVEIISAAQAEPSAVPSAAVNQASTAAQTAEAFPLNKPTGADNEIRVSTVDEFLAAIAPNRTIYLNVGEFNLTKAADYGKNSLSSYYSWVEVFDGYALTIHDLENLEIVGCSATDVLIDTAPRYANVIGFENCKNVSVRGITAGHTEGAGSCSGAVLHFASANDVSVTECVLFGCGTLGVEATECERVLADNCIIKECSLGAASFLHCRDALLRNCLFTDCGSFDSPAYSLLSAMQSEAIAVVNCTVENNVAERLLESGYSRNVQVLGSAIINNRFIQAVFALKQYSPVVEGCAFTDNVCGTWYADGMEPADASTRAVSSAGKELSQEDFTSMQRQEASYERPQATKKPELAAAEGGMREVQASTVDKFLSAIASNTTVYLTDGAYDLSDAENYGAFGTDAYYWMDAYDGPGLIIHNVNNFHIVGAGKGKTSINAIPRYADVLTYENCEDISITGVTLGHSEAPGSCSGGVLRFDRTDSASIQDCGLYGCGILGISAAECNNVAIDNTEIYDCSQGAVYLSACNDVRFTNCSIHDCGEPAFSIANSERISSDGKPMPSDVY